MEITMLEMDPDFFEIDRQIPLGMFPRSTMTSRGIIPYVNRMANREEKIKITVVGDLKGETVVDLLDNCPKIFRIFVVNEYTDSEDDKKMKKLFEVNTEKYKNKIKFMSDRQSNFVCIENRACTVENLKKYYSLVRVGGVFAGNGHEYDHTKIALSEWRRAEKIGIPILVSNRATWFWYKR
jgi:hypothetical protein